MSRKPTAKSPRRAAPRIVKDAAPLERASYSIPEFCRRNGIARGTYFNIREAGNGPKEMRPTGKHKGVVRISAQAEADWIKQCEAMKAAEAAPKTVGR